MAYTLATNSLTAKLLFLMGVDEDGTIKDFKGFTITPHASIATPLQDVGSWNGTERRWFRVNGTGAYSGYNYSVTTGPYAYFGNATAPERNFACFMAIHSRAAGGSTKQPMLIGDLSNGLCTTGLYAGTTSPVKLAFATTLPTDGTTKFSVAGNYNRSSTMNLYYAIEGTPPSTTDATGTDGAGDGVTTALSRVGGSTGDGYMDAKIYLAAMFDSQLSLAEVQSLHADPYAALFETTAASIAPLAYYSYNQQ
jgi:hypothetical protein